ncbi:MAG: hypothetical protein HFH03_02180 [Dorea sp.]|nr:hypothetical protein [Dorea sp.]
MKLVLAAKAGRTSMTARRGHFEPSVKLVLAAKAGSQNFHRKNKER